MAIKMQFEPYCQNCRELEVKQATDELYYNSGSMVETVLYCAHRNRCADMIRHLQEVKHDSSTDEKGGS